MKSPDMAALRARLKEAEPFVGWDGPSQSIHELIAVLSAILDELERLRASPTEMKHNVSFQTFDLHVMVRCTCGWEEIVDRQTDGLMRMRDRASIVARQHIREHQKEG